MSIKQKFNDILKVLIDKPADSVKNADIQKNSLLQTKMSSFLNDALKYREQKHLIPLWQRRTDYYLGNHWLTGREDWKSDVRINLCWLHIQTEIAQLVSTRPTAQAYPTSPNDEENKQAADIFSSIIEAVQQLHLSNKPINFIRDSRLFGAGFLYVGWGDTLHGEDVQLEHIPAEFVLCDPASKSDIQSGRYVIIHKDVPEDIFFERYPKFKENITGGQRTIIINKDFPNERGTTSGTSSAISNYSMRSYDKAGKGRGDMAGYEVGFVPIDEVWWKCHEEQEAPEQIAEETIVNGQSVTETKIVKKTIKKHNNGIRVTTLAEGVVVEDIPSPFDDGLFPLAKFDVNPSDEFYGYVNIDQIMSINSEINQLEV